MTAESFMGKRFDIDNGHIIKSPCRSCKLKNRLPACSNTCKKIMQLQKLLIGAISCSNTCSELEPYSISSGSG